MTKGYLAEEIVKRFVGTEEVQTLSNIMAAVRARDLSVDRLESCMKQRRFRKRQLKAIYEDLQGKFGGVDGYEEDPIRWITGLSVKKEGKEAFLEKIEGFIEHLEEKGLDLDEKVDKQGENIEIYSQFLI